ncbi:exo-beta-N-acetylmuramidase NamZ family protein [Salinimicrobium terrae]|uniref:exo-beta-N-acetylmuramidase NamZ family protein n=1 Tax=Salinimicrobium terrae TaxID=470866 RepID=UPI000402552E|nr:DUF1343 domain-containing protein [Salinimicrobium terrae]
MFLNTFKNLILFLFVITTASCRNQDAKDKNVGAQNSEPLHDPIVLGANRTEAYLPQLENRKVGIIGNNTTVIKKSLSKSPEIEEQEKYTHLVDSLVSLNVNVVKVFAPEHGFRGVEPAGAKITDGVDSKTGLPLLSLYGSNTKPSDEQLEDVDVLIFDIQDVGTRFYTYISTLHLVMEAAAENKIPIIVLDRPNPNGSYIDGPILEAAHQSFVGMDPVPVVHGLTIGEYAQMLNGEKWMNNGIQADLTVVEMENYNHNLQYAPPFKPSPNLPNATAINLYPSLCFFEGTNVNAGRGTSNQFQVFGSPFLNPEVYDYTYVPRPNEGANDPKHNGVTVYGKNLTDHPSINEINLDWLINAYNNTSNKEDFFREGFFTKLAGTKKLQEQIESGMTSQEIKATWKEGLKDYAQIREKYRIYE